MIAALRPHQTKQEPQKSWTFFCSHNHTVRKRNTQKDVLHDNFRCKKRNGQLHCRFQENTMQFSSPLSEDGTISRQKPPTWALPSRTQWWNNVNLLRAWNVDFQETPVNLLPVQHKRVNNVFLRTATKQCRPALHAISYVEEALTTLKAKNPPPMLICFQPPRLLKARLLILEMWRERQEKKS